MTVQGIDLSHFNADQSLVGLGFVANKCTQGTSFVDSTYVSRHAKTRAAGLVFIAYHFGEMTGTAIAQVAHFQATADIQPGDVIALDWEDPADGSVNEWSRYGTTEIKMQAGNLLARLRQVFPANRAIIYMNRSAYATLSGAVLVSTVDGLWIASPGTTPTMPYLFWQYSTAGGIDHDQESQFPTLADLKKWANKMTSPTSDAVALAVAQYKNEADSTDVDAHQHWVDATNALAQARINGSNLTALSTKVDALTTLVKALTVGDTFTLPNGTTFTANVPEAPSGTA